MSTDDFGEINWVVKDPNRKPRVTVESMLDALADRVNAANPTDEDVKAKVQNLSDLIGQVKNLITEIRAADPTVLSS